jgi:hypothetical protein
LECGYGVFGVAAFREFENRRKRVVWTLAEAEGKAVTSPRASGEARVYFLASVNDKNFTQVSLMPCFSP